MMPVVTPMTVQQAIELAVGHEKAGRLADAERIYRDILQQQPDEPIALHLLGRLAMRVGQMPAAEQLLRRSITVDPTVAQRHNDHGVALHSLGRLDEAIEALQAALAIKPDLVETLSNLSAGMNARGQFSSAIELARRATEIDPAYSDAFNNLGNALNWNGHPEQAVDAYRKAVELAPAAAQWHSNLLMVMHYLPEVDPPAMFAAHQAFGQKFASKTRQKHPNRRDKNRRLRIGYVSPDFRQHSVGYFIDAAIEKFDRNAFEVVCYSDVAQPDAMTRRMQSRASAWRAIRGLSHEAVEQLIRRDQIDILIDLAGHSGTNRLPVFAHKPAPVQVTYLGYPDTTGLSAIDHRITDSRADPPDGDADQFNVEELHRLDPCAWCFRPHEPYPPLPPPRGDDHPITFGTFSAISKINDALIAIWGEILRELPHARFCIKAGALAQPEVADRIRAKFQSHGIAPERLDLLGQHLDATKHLSMYDRLDIALDTFPYHGTTTTCEAMWMGVPVVTLAGQTHAGRVGVSLLGILGLDDLIAPNRQAYVRIAIELARDPQRLASLRQSLRPRMLTSPLMNGYDFVRRLESAYCLMWGQWSKHGGKAVV
jgi:predicted O-linked N-acetylglucosamine transferase (SPINDLY family)